jgi:hypothetical protein
MTLDIVMQRLRGAIAAAGSENAWAAENAISQTYVNYVMRGVIKPGPKLLKALGLKKVTSYEKV